MKKNVSLLMVRTFKKYRPNEFLSSQSSYDVIFFIIFFQFFLFFNIYIRISFYLPNHPSMSLPWALIYGPTSFYFILFLRGFQADKTFNLKSFTSLRFDFCNSILWSLTTLHLLTKSFICAVCLFLVAINSGIHKFMYTFLHISYVSSLASLKENIRIWKSHSRV